MNKFIVNENGMADLINAIKKSLKLNEGDAVAAEMNRQSVVLRKDGDFCFVCGSGEELYITGKKRPICGDCLRAMQKAVEMQKTD